MRILDLFCGAGGAAMGYHRAGFDVVGIDWRPQPRYPFEFREGDVLAMMNADALDVDGFDVVHASPPCQLFSTVTPGEHRARHIDGITPTRRYLEARGIPFVIENVPSAPLRNPLQLCGSEFGRVVAGEGGSWHLRRHRWFESTIGMMGAGGCYCRLHRNRIMHVSGTGGGGPSSSHDGGRKATMREARALLGIEWMNRVELSQAIPPVYTEHLGWQLEAALLRG